MTLYWAIAVGINQYQHFQPLIYAAHDAQALRNCLTNEVGFAAGHAVLLTDLSPNSGPNPPTPDRHTIQTTVARVCQQVQPGDVLWFFFSGYGVQSQGRDYLMPVDGDPAQVSTTGIAVESLFSILQSARTDNVLVLLDINRSQGIIAGLGVGTETARLAQDYGMATILSCPAKQFSHETLALRLGLFTTAVLEGLRTQRCVTTEHLGQFLRDRLPELSEHHWRPRQDPVVIIPDGKRYQLIVPGKAIMPGKIMPGKAIAPGADSVPSPEPNQIALAPAPTDWPAPGPETWENVELPTPARFPKTDQRPAVNPSQPLPPAVLPPFPGDPNLAQPGLNQPMPMALVPTAPAVQPPDPSADAIKERSWRRLLQVGGTVLSVLLAAVFIRNIDTVMRTPTGNVAQGGSPGAIAPPPAAAPPSGELPPSPVTVQPPTEVPPAPAGDSQVIAQASGEAASGIGLNPAANSLVVPASPTAPASPTPNPTEPLPGNPAPPPPTAAVESTPIATSSPNPIAAFFSNWFKPDNSGSGSATPPSGTNQPAEPAAIPNPGADGQILNAARAALSRARGESANNQVTEIADAIRVARQIRPDQPSYAQAQADIDRWSAMILDMARGRAAQRNGGDSLLAARNYTQAIAAARLVPDDRRDLFAAAQQNIAEWSQSMLALANINAGLGDLNLAIQVAQQVPQNTPAYPQAQQAIATWQNQLARTVGLGYESELPQPPA